MSINPEPGTKSFAAIEVAGAATERTYVNNPLIGPPRPRTIEIPILNVNGASGGPNVAIVAGTHACEYPAIDAAIQIYRRIEPNELRGRLTIVPVLNTAAFWTRTPYVNPSDGVDIGATYGTEGSSISYLIGKTMVNEVFSKADYVVDLHGGDLLEDIAPHAGYTRIGEKDVDDASEMLAMSYGTEYVFERLVPGAFEKSGMRIPRIMVEAGREGRLEEEYTIIHIKGIMNVLKALDMIEGEPDLPASQVVLHGRYEIFAKRAGMFYPKVQVGESISRGDLLGEIRDFEGETIEKLTAPKAGVVQLIMTNPVKHRDDLLFKCWLP